MCIHRGYIKIVPSFSLYVVTIYLICCASLLLSGRRHSRARRCGHRLGSLLLPLAVVGGAATAVVGPLLAGLHLGGRRLVVVATIRTRGNQRRPALLRSRRRRQSAVGGGRLRLLLRRGLAARGGQHALRVDRRHRLHQPLGRVRGPVLLRHVRGTFLGPRRIGLLVVMLLLAHDAAEIAGRPRRLRLPLLGLLRVATRGHRVGVHGRIGAGRNGPRGGRLRRAAAVRGLALIRSRGDRRRPRGVRN